MHYRTLGRTGLKVSEIGFGAWGISGRQWIGAEDADSLQALERAIDLLFDHRGAFARHLGDLRDDQELRAVEHALFPEREILRAGEKGEALEDFDHVVDRARAHPVRVVLETSFPVLVAVDLAVAEQHEQPFDFFVRDGPAQTNVVDIGDRHEHRRFIRQDSEMEKTASSSENGLFFDLLDDPERGARQLRLDVLSENNLVLDWIHRSLPQAHLERDGATMTGYADLPLREPA